MKSSPKMSFGPKSVTTRKCCDRATSANVSQRDVSPSTGLVVLFIPVMCLGEGSRLKYAAWFVALSNSASMQDRVAPVSTRALTAVLFTRISTLFLIVFDGFCVRMGSVCSGGVADGSDSHCPLGAAWGHILARWPTLLHVLHWYCRNGHELGTCVPPHLKQGLYRYPYPILGPLGAGGPCRMWRGPIRPGGPGRAR